MSTYSLLMTDDGSGNFTVEALRAPTTKASGGTSLGIEWIENLAAGVAPVTITAASNATPIVITATNTFSNGNSVFINGVLGNTAANGTWQISSASGTGFTLTDSAGNAAYTSGGTAQLVPSTKMLSAAVQAGLRAALNDRAAGN